MHFSILTIFPEFFQSPLATGLLGKAIEQGILGVELRQLREFTSDRHQTVDDTPYGGGPGMVMKVEPLVDAIEAIMAGGKVEKRVLLSPRGRRFTQEVAAEYVQCGGVLLVCGRYEGVDERILEGGYITEELSLGDYVLNGGEAAALCVVEACSRLLPNAMGNAASVVQDSFQSGLLDYPHYTKPREYRGLSVPDVLLSGDHGRIEQWRRKRSLEVTLERRPDLFQKVLLSKQDRKLLGE